MNRFLPWLTTLAVLLIGFGTIYAAVQQSQRSDANWPQIQLAEDASNQLFKGELAATVVGPQVDIAKSLAPFLVIYDKTGRVMIGSGYLNGKVAKAPLGILKSAQGKDYNAVTWQPQKGVRIAAVSVAAKDYYVLSGRNLKEVEKNEDTSFKLSALGFLACVIVLGLSAGYYYLERLRTV